MFLIFQKYYRETGSYKLHAQYKGVMASVVWAQVVPDHGVATA